VATPVSDTTSGGQIMIDPVTVRTFLGTACAAVTLLVLLGTPAAVAHSPGDVGQSHATTASAGDESSIHQGPAGLDIDHAAHRQEIESQGDGSYIRNQADYAIPEAHLRDATGKRVTFAETLDYGGPLLMNFIFTSCATICPVMSATFGETQEGLAAIDPSYRMVSVSIDPDYDTPKRLREYAGLHNARDNWVFLTGDAAQIRKVIAAFDAIYRGDNKMYHLPYTYLRPSQGRPWLRIEGLLSGADLIKEYRSMLNEAHSLAD
jgi:cytochrome oxidase Cu insertion factor (SCO1/SenC/PrrC family)